MELAKRDDVPVELTWDLSLIYRSEEAMLADAQKMKWQEIPEALRD